MTTSISAVNSGTMAAGNAIQKTTLNEDTKSKLQALGIEVTEGMTESEAQAKIAQAQQNQKNTGNEQQNETESEFLSEAKTLASSLGVTISTDASVSEILDEIASELEALLDEAENNPGILPQLSSYLSELTSLDSRYDNAQASRINIYAALDMISENNKMALGLQ